MKIINPYRLDTLLSLTASEEASTSFGVGNLQTSLPSGRWRSTSKYPYIVGQMDASHSISFINLLYNNGQLSDWARIRFAANEANLTNGNAVVDINDYMWPGASGFHGYAVFDGTANFDFGDIFDKGAGDSFGVELLFRSSNTGVNQGLANKKEFTGAVAAGWRVTLNSSDAIVVSISDGTDQVQVASSGAYADNVWYHIRVEIDRLLQVIRIYIDGSLVGTSGDISAVGSLANAQSIQIGTLITDGLYFTGDIDEFRLINDITTSMSRIAELDVVSPSSALDVYCRMNDTGSDNATDDSGNSNDGTNTNVTFANADPITYVDLSGYDYIHSNATIALPVAATWFRIDCNFANNTDGYVQGAALPLGNVLILTHGYTESEGNEWPRGMTGKQMSAGGLERGGTGTWKRGKKFHLYLTKDEMLGTVGSLLRERNGIKPVVVVFEDDDEYPMEFIRWGYFDVPVRARGSVEDGGWDCVGRLIEP